jgi:hypothetical protein
LALHAVIILLAVRRAALVGLLGPLSLVGCSLGGDEKAQPPRGATKAVVATVQALERATRRHDFRTICNSLFTDAARRRAGGRGCPRLLRSTGREVRRPSIRVLSIELRGRRATVRVRTRAADQPPIDDTLKLVRGRDGYRIDALAG